MPAAEPWVAPFPKKHDCRTGVSVRRDAGQSRGTAGGTTRNAPVLVGRETSMKAGFPSRTAQSAAAHRAVHQLVDFRHVFDDPLALEVIGLTSLAFTSECAAAWLPGFREMRVPRRPQPICGRPTCRSDCSRDCAVCHSWRGIGHIRLPASLSKKRAKNIRSRSSRHSGVETSATG